MKVMYNYFIESFSEDICIYALMRSSLNEELNKSNSEYLYTLIQVSPAKIESIALNHMKIVVIYVYIYICVCVYNE